MKSTYAPDGQHIKKNMIFCINIYLQQSVWYCPPIRFTYKVIWQMIMQF